MKQLFKTSFAGMKNNCKFTKSLLFLIAFFLAVAGVTITAMIKIDMDLNGLIGGSILSLICFILPGIPFFCFICSLITNVRFKKVFGFWAPLTYDGKEALQKVVNRKLSLDARSLKAVWGVEEGLFRELSTIAKRDVATLGQHIEVAKLENSLIGLQWKKQNKKKAFWKHRKIAQHKFLPKPFKVFDTVDFYSVLLIE